MASLSLYQEKCSPYICSKGPSPPGNRRIGRWCRLEQQRRSLLNSSWGNDSGLVGMPWARDELATSQCRTHCRLTDAMPANFLGSPMARGGHVTDKFLPSPSTSNVPLIPGFWLTSMPSIPPRLRSAPTLILGAVVRNWYTFRSSPAPHEPNACSVFSVSRFPPAHFPSNVWKVCLRWLVVIQRLAAFAACTSLGASDSSDRMTPSASCSSVPISTPAARACW